MARYVDGYVLPIPRKNVKEYTRIAKIASKVWMDHGALQYCECVGDDLDCKFGVTFPKQIKTRPGETVVLAFVTYKSRAHRDRVNAAVMKDPRIAKLADPGNPMPFDCKRMVYGGFSVIVNG